MMVVRINYLLYIFINFILLQNTNLQRLVHGTQINWNSKYNMQVFLIVVYTVADLPTEMENIFTKT